MLSCKASSAAISISVSTFSACGFPPCASAGKIFLLIVYFLERVLRTSGQEKILSDEGLKAMLAYDWPGNVRELENCLERTYAFTSGPLIHQICLAKSPISPARPVERKWQRQRQCPRQDHSNCGTGEANHLERNHRTQWRQTASRASVGSWKDDPLPQA
jgi:DNA-binding NtrC family response regulator